MDIVVTPVCPICLKNYSSTCIPRIFYPCGHGICNYCLIQLKDHSENPGEITCPQCREPVVQDFSNYDLQDITNNVNTDVLGYWSRRLLEAVGLDGTTVHINDRIKPFCQTLFTRLVFKDDYRAMDGTEEVLWTEDERQKVKSLIKTMLHALLESQVDSKEAISWVTVFQLPSNIEKKVLNDVNKFYESIQFLEEINATWVMDAILS